MKSIGTLINSLKESVCSIFKTFTEKDPISPEVPKETSVKAAEPVTLPEIYRLVPRLKDADSEELFRSVHPGDIVYAAMSLPSEVLETIHPDHRLRPYIIVRKTEDGIIAYGSYSGWMGKKEQIKFNLTPDSYDVKKVGHVILRKADFIPKTNLLQYVDHVSIHDQIKMNMIMDINRIPAENSPRFKAHKMLHYNSVIKKDMEYYYIFDRKGNTADVYPLTRNKTDIPVRLNGIRWYVDCRNKQRIQLDDTCIPIGQLENEVRYLIADYHLSQAAHTYTAPKEAIA